MPTITISLKEIAELSMKGRIAAAVHCVVSAERRVVVEVSPDGVGYMEGSNIPIDPAHGAGEDSVFLDTESGRIWWGSMTTLRLLESEHSPLESGTIIKDAANAAYQRALLHKAG